MKIVRLIIKIFNCVIIAISAVATVFLFASPSLSLNSRIDVNVEKLAEFIPKNDYSKDINVVESLGTDTISGSLKFKIYAGDIPKIMKNDKERINEILIDNNVQDLVKELHEPVNILTEQSIRTAMRSTVKNEITTQIHNAREKYETDHPESPKSTDEQIMSQLKINDKYFDAFSTTLYDASDADNANLTNVYNVVLVRVDEIMANAKKKGLKVDTTTFTAEQREAVKSNVKKIYTQMQLVKSDEEHLEKISDIAYVYLTNYLKDELQKKKGTLDPEYEQKAGETKSDYTDRLLGRFVDEQLPDVFYNVVRYVAIGLFIGLFIFTLTWVGLIVITVLRTFVTKKTWTFFGPWFWIIGLLQVALGFVLTHVGKYVLPEKFDITKLNLPISKVLLAPRTYCLVPSILFCVCVGLAIAYLVLKIVFKKKLKNEDSNPKEAA